MLLACVITILVFIIYREIVKRTFSVDLLEIILHPKDAAEEAAREYLKNMEKG